MLGKKGWYFDAVNPDLGPVNGPNPLQELIKANYLFTALMINNGLLDHVIAPKTDMLKDIEEQFKQQSIIPTSI